MRSKERHDFVFTQRQRPITSTLRLLRRYLLLSHRAILICLRRRLRLGLGLARGGPHVGSPRDLCMLMKLIDLSRQVRDLQGCGAEVG